MHLTNLRISYATPQYYVFLIVTGNTFLETDASIQGISYILGQRDDEGRKYVVSYGGRVLRQCDSARQRKGWLPRPNAQIPLPK